MTHRNLTCFGVNGTSARFYYLDTHQHVNEVAYAGGWVSTDMTAASGAPLASATGSLTVFGEAGANTRLYYVAASGHVIELAWVGHWIYTDVTAASGAPAANSGSILASFAVNGTDTRVYFLNAQNHVIEIAYAGRWVSSDVTAAASAAAAVAGSSLACFGVNGTDTRVYFLDAQGQVNELAWVGHWVASNVSAAAGAAAAEGGSDLACFGVNKTDTRAYYTTANNHVMELAWVGHWVVTDVTAASAGHPAQAGSSLACFGVNGTDTRLYYVDTWNSVIETAWVGHWQSQSLTGAAGVPLAASYAAIACFAQGGSATRLYYQTQQGFINELSWNNVWVNRAVWPAFPPTITAAKPSSGLGSNSNYLMSASCSALTSVGAKIDVTQDIAGSDGFGFQLNAYSKSGEFDGAQQYLIYLDPHSSPAQLYCMVDNWKKNADNSGTQIINHIVSLATLPSQKLPAGYQMTITLLYDPNSNVTGATYVVLDSNGKQIGNQTISLLSLKLVAGGNVTTADLAPITAFQMDFVDYLNAGTTSLSSGAGAVTYNAGLSMTALSTEPSCVEWSYVTLEKANSSYGALPVNANSVFMQSFGTSSATIAKTAPVMHATRAMEREAVGA